MDYSHLVKMANDIGSFFASEPDAAVAAKSIAQHIERYWDPRMRRQIVTHYRDGGEGLADTPMRAVALLAQVANDRDNAVRP